MKPYLWQVFLPEKLHALELLGWGRSRGIGTQKVLPAAHALAAPEGHSLGISKRNGFAAGFHFGRQDDITFGSSKFRAGYGHGVPYFWSKLLLFQILSGA